ncbi:hypothetical protein AMTR_s00071p00105770 [Amborella trichopoda]|uniref:Leucine-rich repeat-containing N-terminal plant-type domain-containing protein n=1 Tax=Amborella trichopoda TaxID=13333 RepID=U5DHH4_AMBTC|nr:hypothetical protein AMTR_s00071p00105770 [Amborella trichopoda]
MLPVGAEFLDFSYNLFSSTIPENIGLFLNFTGILSFSGNKLIGKIPFSICNARNLEALDMSLNNLNGSIPECLFTITSLTVLDLRKNKLQGPIPDSFTSHSQLGTLNLNGDEFQGSLTQLRVMVLRSNRFDGSIPESKSVAFSMFQIIDLSSNDFSGSFPKEFLQNLKAMSVVSQTNSPHILQYTYSAANGNGSLFDRYYYQSTVTLRIKGMDLQLQKTLTILTVIDLSNNALEGETPDQIGGLKGLCILNMSRNNLQGHIPEAIGALKQLESLFLLQNQLTGAIPTGLSQISFLSVLNLSWNSLSGMIPKGTQLQCFFFCQQPRALWATIGSGL